MFFVYGHNGVGILHMYMLLYWSLYFMELETCSVQTVNGERALSHYFSLRTASEERGRSWNPRTSDEPTVLVNVNLASLEHLVRREHSA